MNDLATTLATTNRENMWALTRGQRTRYFLSIVVATLGNIFVLGTPIIGKYAIDVITLADFSHAQAELLAITRWIAGTDSYVWYLVLSAVGVLITTCLSASCQFGRDRLSAVASENIAKRIRETLFHRLHHAPAKFFDESETGDLVQRSTSDVETVRVFMHSDVDEIGRAVLLMAVMIPVLFWHNVTLSWVSLMLMPVLVVGATFFFFRIKHLFLITDESEGALTAVIQENLTGIRVVQAFARQPFENKRFGGRNAAFRDNYCKLNLVMAWYWGISDVVAMFQSGLVLIVGAYLITQETITMGELYMFISLVSIVIWRIRHVGRLLFDAGKAVVSLGRINHILATPEEPQGFLPNRPRIDGGISFRNVCLDYGDGTRALNDISLEIQHGETIGIVGAPGSGKSTLIRSLLAMYPISSGTLALDGIDITKVDLKWLRSQIGVVLQDPFLYAKTIEENLRVGRADAFEKDIRQASLEAAIHHAIMDFRDGYNALIGERGVTLSGGQRQRVALARALLKNPPILVLDDALSAVDSGTEHHILNALEARRGRHTTLVIAHRLSTIQHADRVVVMEHGRVAQCGTHEELMHSGGFYRELCDLQSLMNESIQFEVEQATHV